METLRFNLQHTAGKFKVLNATNGGPWHKRHAVDQWRTNFEAYKAAKIPYARNHDSSYCSIYGGQYAHDITAIFPDFNADPLDPASYDFACTDESILTTLEAGTETFFRLGQKIEHEIKKHAIFPPKDFQKWAIICEHIIRHYNEGWANGFHLNIQYWEIWNEPDLDPEESQNRRTWGGSKAQFFDFYEVAAKHLKSCFPHLKIGGPALAFNEEWAADFLAEMQKRAVEIDFFSWHIYPTEPVQITEKAERLKKLLVQYGYEKTESILNEWNYIKGWTDQFVYSIQCIQGMKGAAFVMACMSVAQHSSIDMLMYYDTLPSAFCGAFDFYTYEPKKTYYSLYWYGKFYDLKAEVLSENKLPNIYSLCGVTKENKALAVITYYTDDDSAPEKEIQVDFGSFGNYNLYLLDETHNAELIGQTQNVNLTLKANSCVLIEEI